MKKITKLLVLAVLGLIIFTNQGFAQTYEENFVDGMLFFKIKDDVVLRIQKNEDLSVNIKDVPFLMDLKQQFPSIKEVKQAFFLKKQSPSTKRIYAMHFTDYTKVDALVAALEKQSVVEYAEKVAIPKLLYSVNDPIYNNTGGAYNINYNWHLDKINAEAAWDITTGNSNVKVAIVDNAVWESHPDLNLASNNLFTCTDYSGNGTSGTAAPPASVSQTVTTQEVQSNSEDNGYAFSHGTHCAGLVGATTNNNIGVASIGHGVTLMGVRIANDAGQLMYTYAGAQWAAENGADVISMSYGGSTYQQALEAIYEDIRTNYGCILIAAAGNSGIDEQMYPAAYDCVIAVAMSDFDDELNYSPASGGNPESGSNYGTWVDIAAPGGIDGTGFQSGGIGLFSTTYCNNVYEENFLGGYANVTGYYDNMTGTSMATPLAAGVIGLMLSLKSDLTQAEVLSCLQSTADPIQGSHQINANGGRIDAEAALQCVQSMLTTAPVADFTFNPNPGIVNSPVQFTETCTGGTPTSYSWTFGDGGTSTDPNPTHTYSATGSYSVSLSVTNSYGSNSISKTVVVEEQSLECDTVRYPLDQIAAYTDPGNGYVVGTDSYGDEAYADQFETSVAVTISEVIFGVLRAHGTGTFDVVVYDDNGGNGPNNALGTTTVNLSSITEQGYNIVPLSTPVTIDAGSTYYVGVVLPTASTDTLALYTSPDGASPNTTWELYSGTWSEITTYWPSLSGINSAIHPIACPLSSDINDIAVENNITLYPNPTNGHITIQGLESNEQVEISVYNVVGKVVYSQLFVADNNTIQLSLSNQNAGVYFVRIKSDKGIKTEKISIID